MEEKASKEGAVGSRSELSKGLKVWIPDKDAGWRSATVIDPSDFENVSVQPDEPPTERLSLPGSSLFIQNPAILEGVDDMTQLSYLHEPAILHNLSTRYSLNIIYTYTGSILIAVNPYRNLNIFSKEVIDAYAGQPLGRLPAHVYAIADDAWRSMLQESANQSILVSGESGAGKTQTTKYLLQYFAAMGSREKKKLNNAGTTPVAGGEGIEKRVLESTPLLEAFGNAKTLRNDNSSRFGKFIEIQFDPNGIIVGAKISTYLLEKSRIVRQTLGERNYHVFYQLTRGATEEEREKWKISSPEQNFYLNQHEYTADSEEIQLNVEGVPDHEHFRRTKAAMTIVGITPEEQDLVFSVVSVVLTLGNILFEPVAQTESSKIPESSMNHLQTAASLLKCKAESMDKYFVSRLMSAGNETYLVPLSPSQAASTRDAFALLLYSRLFEWLVKRINASIQSKQAFQYFIGVLDIYGFESFVTNSFEQFCINFANEKLQQHFNQTVFSLEQKEYEKEEIDWSYIDFNDNQECLDLLEKKPICVLSILDEECKFPKSTAETFAQKLYANFIHKKHHPYFDKPRFSNVQFAIRHYAGQVSYDTDSFLEKNRDYIVPEHLNILSQSESPFVKELVQDLVKEMAAKSKGGKSSYQFVSVGSQFRDSLASLLDSIHKTTPHYIRCIKPNNQKKPMLFEKMQVLHQLRCGGVMECIRISKAGYPTRRVYDGFLRRFLLLAPKLLSKKDANANPRKQCQALVEALQVGADEYQLGLTKIFMRSGVVGRLEKMRGDMLNSSATKIQKVWRGHVYKSRYEKIKRCALSLQSFVRMILGKHALGGLRRIAASIAIQKQARCMLQRNRFLRIKQAAVALQNAVRNLESRKQFAEMKRQSATVTLQSVIRASIAQAAFHRTRRAIILAQTRWRGKQARKILAELRVEARSLSNIVAQKNELERKLEELQWRYTAEVKVQQRSKDQNQKNEALIQDMQREIDRLLLVEHEFKGLKVKHELLRQKLEHEEAQRESLQEVISDLKEQSKNRDDEAKKLRAKLNESVVEARDLRSTVENEANRRLTALTASRDDVELQLKKENEELQAKMHGLEHANDELLKELAELRAAAAPPPRSPRSRRSLVSTPTFVRIVRKLNVTEVEETKPAEVSIVRTITDLAGKNEEAGVKLLIELLYQNSASKMKLDQSPLSVIYHGLPLPTFVILRCFMLNPYELEGSLIKFIADFNNHFIPKLGSDITVLSFWLSNAALLLHMSCSEENVFISLDNVSHAMKKQDSYDAAPMEMLINSVGRIYARFLNSVYKLLRPALINSIEEKIALDQSNVKEITRILSLIVIAMQTSLINEALSQKIFQQIFYYINSIVFNEIVLRRDLCTFSKGLEMKMKLSGIEIWSRKPENKDWTGEAYKELEMSKQLSSILTVDKTMLTNADMREAICPHLNLVQIKQLLSSYQADESLENPVSIHTIQQIVQSKDYNLEDQLLLDPAELSPVNLDILHHLEFEDLNVIAFPKVLQVELEREFWLKKESQNANETTSEASITIPRKLSSA
eukprot:TRINITY_DN4783_c0_g1_i3.p1 TRINITY_DN4783_c0_g1~~TRINITY_DN4783_c0_g1_i3.p1  ORF type:complete len:1580 (-),score=460.18 TRINITY_DN4783_c0_g1_i3:46-4674(-)